MKAVKESKKVKKAKTVKPERITEWELSALQKTAKAIDESIFRVGEIELAKTKAVKNYEANQSNLNDLQHTLKASYGNVKINIHDGSINREDEDNKKD